MNDSKAAIILAAGKGKRMKSDLPKVLHEIAGKPMIRHVLDMLTPLQFDKTIVVIGHKGELVKEALRDYPVRFAWQHEQLGTGDAVKMAADELADFDGTTLVAAGDVPFLSADAVSLLLDTHRRTGAAATCLSAVFDDPSGYGRIIRDGNSDRLAAIVEDKDADEDQKAIHEINSGTFCFDNRLLFDSLGQLTNDNAQGEYYLTDVIKILHDKGLTVSVVPAPNPREVLGVNSVEQLRALEKEFIG